MGRKASALKHYLVTYNRETCSSEVLEFDDARVAHAEFALRELRLMDEKHFEIVLLSAESEDEIRRTHSTYFSGGRIPF